MTALLEVRDLTIAFPSAKPVRALNFSINARETVAIVGESGSGKSLTALGLMGLLPSNATIPDGRVVFDGRDLVQLPDSDYRKIRGRDIAMIFQEPMTSLNPVIPVGRQISEVVRLHHGLSPQAARQRAIELLDLVRIPDPQRRIDEYPHQFSGGMRQRVMIAIAVACSPKLLIADEPTTALDVTIQAQVLDLLDKLRRDLDMALLLITHDLGVVAEWADRVVVMYAGRKVEEAQYTELFQTPRHPYTRGLLNASPRLSAELHYTRSRLAEIPGSITSAGKTYGCAFAPRCPQQIASCHSHLPPLLRVGPDHFAACPVTAEQELGDVALAG